MAAALAPCLAEPLSIYVYVFSFYGLLGEVLPQDSAHAMAPCRPCGKLLVMASPESDRKWSRTDMQVLVAT